MKKKHKQRAKLRVIRRSHDGQYAQVFFVRLVGDDLYMGSGNREGANKMRRSYHASGAQRMHTAVGTFAEPRRKPLRALTKPDLLWSTTSGTDTWGYAPKPDNYRSKSLICDDEDHPNGFNVTLLALPIGFSAMIDDVISGRSFGEARDNLVVTGHVLSDWTDPVLLVVVSKFSDAALSTIRGSGGEEPMERFIWGPSAEDGLEWGVLGELPAGAPIPKF